MTARQRDAAWEPLDNAAKIFPSISSKRDTKVFCFACELREGVDPALLQRALDETIEDFPIFRSTLRQGFFWHYLKESSQRPLVQLESELPCSNLYDANNPGLLFEVSYYGRRINLEVYHALTDGTGALQFLRALVCRYLYLRHPEGFDAPPTPLHGASFSELAEDSFQKYYTTSSKNKVRSEPVYKLRGVRLPEGRMQIIEGVLPVKAVLAAARERGVTMTVLLTALFLCAVDKNAVLRRKRHPVVAAVPVNLRNYFPSETARNFFCTINVGYHFGRDPGDLESVMASVRRQFEQLLTRENLAKRMNGYSAIEHNALVRVVPLGLKNIILRIAGAIAEHDHTISISNIGKVSMPAGCERYIRLFDVFVSTNILQLCLCSFGEDLTLSFSSAFRNTDVQKDFFRFLTGMGIPVEITTNRPEEEVRP